MDSYPPQCGGPDLVGWQWDEVGAFERANGTTWGAYVVIGTYDPDADTFTPSKTAVPAEEYDGPRPVAEDGYSPPGTPCDEPAGGWQVVDLASATDAALAEVQRVAQRLPGPRGRCACRGAEHTQGELRAIQQELTDLDWMLSVGAAHDHVSLTVVHDDGALQRRLDERYGGGVVEVSSALQPYPG